jgi:hypothetical protein
MLDDTYGKDKLPRRVRMALLRSGLKERIRLLRKYSGTYVGYSSPVPLSGLSSWRRCGLTPVMPPGTPLWCSSAGGRSAGCRRASHASSTHHRNHAGRSTSVGDFTPHGRSVSASRQCGRVPRSRSLD